jgi:hypothetical protein
VFNLSRLGDKVKSHGASTRVAASDGFAIEVVLESFLFAGGFANVDEFAARACAGGQGFGCAVDDGLECRLLYALLRRSWPWR